MTNTIHTIGVCGAGGTMGAGTAIVAAAERAEICR
jgi:3-hydroxyacyl-CoA dehydrogenase